MLRKYFEEFMADVPAQLPQLIHKSWMKKPIIYDEYILLEFNFPQAFSLEDIMNMFEDQMELIILYHMVPSTSTSFGHCCCAYTNPAFGHMYKMNVMIDGNGLVNRVTVTIFDSLEFMGGDLCNDLELHAKTGSFKYRQNKFEVLSYFIN
jgi:hypothetical protein